MTGEEQLEQMRQFLVPKGTLDLVRLHLQSATYVDKEFIAECLGEIQRLPVNITLGEPVTALQKLAIMVLKDSAYIE